MKGLLGIFSSGLSHGQHGTQASEILVAADWIVVEWTMTGNIL